MRVVVTRPVEDAERLVKPLRARNVDVFVEPLMVVVTAAAAQISLEGVQAYLLTSANGVRALAGAVGTDAYARGVPALAVGDQTAQTLREHGFTQVLSADGDVHALAALVRRTLKPDSGVLLHAAGSTVAGDLQALLDPAGFAVRREVLYETRAAVAFSAPMRELLRERAVDCVFLYSPRTARTFAALAKKHELEDSLGTVAVYCLSPAVAEALQELPFAAVRVAADPRQDALLDLFDADYRGRITSPPAPLAPAGATDAAITGGVTMADRPKDEDNKPTEARAADSGKTGPAKGETDPKPQAESQAKASPNADAKPAPKAEAQPAPSKATPSSPPPSGGTSSTTTTGAAKTADAAKPVPSAGGGGRVVAYGVVAVLVVLLVAWATLPLWISALPDGVRQRVQHLVPGSGQSEQVMTVAQEVEDLRLALGSLRTELSQTQERVEQIAQQPPSEAGQVPQELTDRLSAVEQQVTTLRDRAPQGLEQKISDLQTRTEELAANRAQASAVLSLSERVAAVEAMARKAVSRQDRALAFLLAVGQLREAVDSGRPFENELKTAAAVAPAQIAVRQAVEGFAGHADSGLPTKTVLRQRLESLGAEVIRADAVPQDGESWWNRTVDHVLGVVSVRRVDGEAVGDAPAALVSRAEAALEDGNLSAAVAEMSKLQRAPAEVAAAWLADARARLAAAEGLNDLTGEALARLTAEESSGDSGDAATDGREG